MKRDEQSLTVRDRFPYIIFGPALCTFFTIKINVHIHTFIQAFLYTIFRYDRRAFRNRFPHVRRWLCVVIGHVVHCTTMSLIRTIWLMPDSYDLLLSPFFISIQVVWSNRWILRKCFVQKIHFDPRISSPQCKFNLNWLHDFRKIGLKYMTLEGLFPLSFPSCVKWINAFDYQ